MSDPLSAAQLSEVRAAVDVLQQAAPGGWEHQGRLLLGLTGMGFENGALVSDSQWFDVQQGALFDSLTGLLNAAPSLLAMAEAAALPGLYQGYRCEYCGADLRVIYRQVGI